MMIVLTGGSKCGKSSLAEKLLLRLGQEDVEGMVYLATMQVIDGEDQRIVQRHQRIRAGKGFAVVEQCRSLDTLDLPPETALLLEDAPNVLANEMFGGGGPTCALKGILHLHQHCRHLIIVTNEVGSDGFSYAPETTQYIDELGKLNQALAKAADCVAEVVLGIPQLLKGKLP